MNNAIKINKSLIICIVLLFGLIIGKLIYVSASTYIDGIDIKKFALSRTTGKKILYASRGTIYDSSGEVLAENVNSYTVIAYLSESRTTNKDNPKHVVNINETAEKLAPIIGMDIDRLKSLLKRDAYQVELGPEGRGISELVKEKIDELNLPGIDYIKTSKRYYPYGSFASYLLGYAKKNDNDEIIGEMGIEAYYNEELSGENGEYIYQKDPYGYQIANTPVQEKKSENGYDIELTLDSNIQMYLENAINELKNNYETDWVTVTVADAKTGAIVGSATNPTFDPNKLNITNYNNPLVSYTYEPGSTMKIFSFASSIEEGLYNGNETYNSGKITVDNYEIKDWNDKGWGVINYDVGFTYSSNVAATLLAQNLGKEKLLDYYTELGFGQKTNIELNGELKGKVSFLYNSELAAASYGQGITVTPIQMIQALTTITNNGTVLKPYIVNKITDQNNNVIYEGKREELNKIYSEETINKIVDLMDLTVNGSDSAATGKVYQTEEVRLIGKTGTAQYTTSSGGYAKGEYQNIRSFAGIFPKEEPEYIIYVAVKDLVGSSRAIGNMTKSIVESIAKYKNLSERESNKDESKYVDLEQYVNKKVDEVKKDLENKNLIPVIIGDGDIIIEQYPKKNNNIIIGSKIFLKTNSDKKIMPDITDYNLSELITLLNLLEIEYEINGSGKNIKTNILPNTEITEKVIINLES
ncbi:MAG: PASTA domain-containing protein [Bacilli bacterium]|nr:PASTA domain-containing protein [Bacilli bacterium]